MAKKISQDTFDSVVKENVEDFEMSVSDAVQDAIEQFKAQGVDLSSVMQDASSYLSDGSKDLSNSLPHKVEGLVAVLNGVVAVIKPELRNLNVSEENSGTLSNACHTISTICKTGLAERIVVSKANTFDVLIEGLYRLGEYNWEIVLNPDFSFGLNNEVDKEETSDSAQTTNQILNKDLTYVNSDSTINTEHISSLSHSTKSSTHVWNILNNLLTTISNTIYQQPDLLTQKSFAILKKFNDLLVQNLLESMKKFDGGEDGGISSCNGGVGGDTNINKDNCRGNVEVINKPEDHFKSSNNDTQELNKDVKINDLTIQTTITKIIPQNIPQTTTTQKPQITTEIIPHNIPQTTTQNPQIITFTPQNIPQTTSTPHLTIFNLHTLASLQSIIDIFSKCCFMHEANKQLFFNSDLTQCYFGLLKDFASLQNNISLNPQLKNPPQFKPLTYKVCVFVRGLVSDDDIRVTFGSSHENCLVLVNQRSAMSVLLAVFKVFNRKEKNEIETNKESTNTTKDDTTNIDTINKDTNNNPTTNNDINNSTTNKSLTDRVLTEILNTIACLAVREEICLMVCEKGGLKDVMELLGRCGGEAQSGFGGGKSRVSLIKAALQFIRTLSGSDKVKMDVVEKEGASIILPSLLICYLHDSSICEAGVLCVAGVCLRHEHLGARFIDDGQINVVVCKVMEMHKKKPSVLKACSIMIRNIVSRNQDKIEVFLHEGLERQLNKAIHEYEKECGEEARYALRDLMCEVTLREMWSGEGKQIDR